MDNIIQFQTNPPITTGTVYVNIRQDGNVWDSNNSSAMVAYNASNVTHYALAATHNGGGYYTVTPPGGLPAGSYYIVAFIQDGGSASTTDSIIAEGLFTWQVASSPTPPSGLDLTTLAYVKTALQITASTWDTYISQWITAASAEVTRYLNNRQLVSQSYNEIRNGFDTDFIRVWHPPINSLGNIVFDYDTTTPTTVPNTEFSYNPETGVIKFRPQSTYWRAFNTGFQNISVTYTGGYLTIPADVQSGVAIMVGIALFLYNKPGMNVQSKRVGDVQVNYRNPLVFNLDDPLFAEAAAIFNKYKLRRT